MKNNTMRRAASAAAIAGVSAVALASMGAGNAAAATLPNKVITQKLVDGTSVTVSLTDQAYNVSRSVAAIPTSRHAWVSGKVRVTVNGKSQGGSIVAGYYVGCQVAIGAGATAGAGGTAGIAGSSDQVLDPTTNVISSGPSTYAPNAGATATQGISLTLAPGAIGFFPVVSYTNSDGDTVNGVAFSGSKAGIAYSQVDFSVEQCAGYAEAKAYVKVKVSTPSVDGYVTLVGRPFSLG
ncbi:MspA family porin [Williamsia herbipolensis]|uniref:MspA family porin n=1 Tax=Williamsia herbipolensis TaxID=1603258 RepID=UPI0005F85099|nr:MspA family porin [Williamsia herbipolensis]